MAGRVFCAFGLALASIATGIASAQTPPAAKGSEGSKSSAPALEIVGDPIDFSVERPARPRFYGGADYLLWWIRRGPLPNQPLVTTGDETVSPAAGIIGDPTTQPLFGGNRGLEWGTFSGARVWAGFDIAADGAWSFDAGGFWLLRKQINFGAASRGDGVPLITRPIFDNLDHAEGVYDVSSSDAILGPRVSGSIDIQATTELWGYELNLAAHPINQKGAAIDLFFGFRSVGLDENIRFHANVAAAQAGFLTYLANPVDPPGSVSITDVFGATNRFNGAQIGARYGWQWGDLGATLIGKVALGVNQQRVSINGQTILFANGVQADQAVGGTLAQATNIGVFARDEFCLVPEIGLNVHYDLTKRLRARLGYNLLYMSSVVRPGSHIDRTIDITQVPTDQAFGALVNGVPVPVIRPGFVFRDTDFWAHGLNFGFEIRY